MGVTSFLGNKIRIWYPVDEYSKDFTPIHVEFYKYEDDNIKLTCDTFVYTNKWCIPNKDEVDTYYNEEYCPLEAPILKYIDALHLAYNTISNKGGFDITVDIADEYGGRISYYTEITDNTIIQLLDKIKYCLDNNIELIEE